MRGAGLRSYDMADFDADRLVAAKGDRTVSVCLPARDEEATVGAIVSAVVDRLVARTGLVDEVVVVDDHSRDRTAAVAAAAGARVVEAAAVLVEYGEGPGKGQALWKSLFASRGDVVAWCDADIVAFDPRFVVGLLGPLLLTDDVVFVKGFYDRPLDGRPEEGGRVTELVARPLLSLLFPPLSDVVQPLGGEYAGRRDLLERLPFVEGYGVDLGLLLDVAGAAGLPAIAQVDLGTRAHRNRPLAELSPQALAVAQVALRRAGHALDGGGAVLRRPGAEPVRIDGGERPPMVEVPAYRAAPSAGQGDPGGRR